MPTSKPPSPSAPPPQGDPRPALRRVARRLQRSRILPHCGACSLPCCTLETLVLELDWTRLRGLWGIAQSKRRFDRDLKQGRGPREIRAQGGLYYAHKRVCPAYRERRCSVYDSALKPPGCSDFPLYEQDGELVADLRCEALQLAAVEAELARCLPPGSRWERREDPDFPFLVSFVVGVNR